jgi:hypothetical protein
MRHFLCLLLLIPFSTFSQIKISGKVISNVDKKPIANASVFLSNAMVGNKTNDDGIFILNNVRPGQYDLVISIVGYETYHQTVKITNSDTALGDIEIAIKENILQEVVIKPNKFRDRDYITFERLFLGSSDNASDCKILNPDILNIQDNTEIRTLTVSTDDFLVIENKALGYRLKYLLTKFTMDYKTEELFYEGSVLFEELAGTPSQQKRWQKKRLETYEGSSMHFLRSVLNADLTGNNFIVYKLNRKPNPAWRGGVNGKWIQSVDKTPLNANDFAKLTDQKGIFALNYPNCLYVMYTQKRDNSESSVYKSVDLPDYYGSIINFSAPYVLFDNNGVITNPYSCILEGSWGQSHVADLLPVDYMP